MSRKQKTHPRVMTVGGCASWEESGRARRYAYDIACVPPLLPSLTIPHGLRT